MHISEGVCVPLYGGVRYQLSTTKLILHLDAFALM
jgi:hypothetical protein